MNCKSIERKRIVFYTFRIYQSLSVQLFFESIITLVVIKFSYILFQLNPASKHIVIDLTNMKNFLEKHKDTVRCHLIYYVIFQINPLCAHALIFPNAFQYSVTNAAENCELISAQCCILYRSQSFQKQSSRAVLRKRCSENMQ